jgi:D-amino-acid dehydrogenase
MAFRKGLLATAELSARTFQLFDDLSQRGVNFEQHRKGLVFVFRSKDELHRDLEVLELLRPFGYSPAALDPSEVQDLEPAVREDIAGGIWISQERQVRPDDLVMALGKQLLNDGVALQEGVAVDAIEAAAGVVKGVHARGRVIPADAVVIAAGVWMPRLLRDLKIRIPIEPGKGYSLDFLSPRMEIAHALYLYEARVAVTPFEGRIRLAGTMELSGINDQIVHERVDAIVDAAATYLKNWPIDCERGRPWTGMRPMTPDGLPVIGRVPSLENLFLAGGHAMLGVTLGPVTGEELAELIVSERMPPVLAPFDPQRFARRDRRLSARRFS